MTATARLFHVQPVEEPPDAPLEAPTAEDVKAALRRRHPGSDVGGMVGQWTCIEEWQGIDLLALNAWSKADVIGYEVKVSRSDLRKELLRPTKRAAAVAVTTEFYFAVPAGLLTDEELAFEEPEWGPGDFDRPACTNPDCRAYGRRRRLRDKGTDHEAATVYHADERFFGIARACCLRCRGTGAADKSRVELLAPTVWVPRDVGLVTVSQRGCRVVKPSPKRKDPTPIAASRKQINDLVRWVSHRPDPRHR